MKYSLFIIFLLPLISYLSHSHEVDTTSSYPDFKYGCRFPEDEYPNDSRFGGENLIGMDVSSESSFQKLQKHLKNKTFPIFIDARMSYANLKNINLSDYKFHNSCLYKTDLSNANLSNTIFADTDLIKANLSNADLSNSRLVNVILTNVNSTGANLSNTGFVDSILENVNLTGANLSNSWLININLTDINLTGANLSNVKFTNVILENVNLKNSRMPEHLANKLLNENKISKETYDSLDIQSI